MKQIALQKYTIIATFAGLILLGSPLSGQDTEKDQKFQFSGSVDAYYRTNFNGMNKAIPDDSGDIIAFPAAPGTSFANDTGFAIGMVNLIASYKGEKVGFVGDLAFGPRGEDAVFNSLGSPAIVNQLYVYWNVTEKVTLTFGNFNTFLGYEVISPAANFNYSTSYMFSYGPFSHTGMKVDFDLGGGLSAMLAVLNPTDWTEFDPFGTLSLGAQIGYSGQYLNFLYGKQGFTEFFDSASGTLQDTDIKPLFQVDYTGGFDLTENFYLGINATYQDTDGTGFYGAALYPQLKTSETFSIGLRGEYFKEMGDYGAIGTGVDNSSVFALTLTGSATIGKLILKPELRLDSASDDSFLFVNKDLEAGKNLSSFLLAAVFAF